MEVFVKGRFIYFRFESGIAGCDYILTSGLNFKFDLKSKFNEVSKIFNPSCKSMWRLVTV
jgi:hypothetical protein